MRHKMLQVTNKW